MFSGDFYERLSVCRRVHLEILPCCLPPANCSPAAGLGLGILELSLRARRQC